MAIDVRKLSIGVREKGKYLPLLRNVSFQLEKGRCLGVLGESGSGKSLLCKAILGLLDRRYLVGGEIFFEGRDLLNGGGGSAGSPRRGKIRAVLQNPMSSFNPLYTVGAQIVETLRAHRNVSASRAWNDAEELLKRVDIDDTAVLRYYPHELSGGMLQRVMIGLALAYGSSLVVADEPTTALDTVTQRDILAEFLKIKEKNDCSILFVTHDLGVLAKIGDGLLVMHDGEIVERGMLKELYKFPISRHTRRLMETRRTLARTFKATVGSPAVPDGEEGYELAAGC